MTLYIKNSILSHDTNVLQDDDITTDRVWEVFVGTLTKLIDDKMHVPVNKRTQVRKHWKPHLYIEAKQSIRHKRRKWVNFVRYLKQQALLEIHKKQTKNRDFYNQRG